VLKLDIEFCVWQGLGGSYQGVAFLTEDALAICPGKYLVVCGEVCPEVALLV
jgi:hypothetical protein